MKENFEKSLEKILKYEGGFSNHPLDKGGATNQGITLATLQEFFADYDYGDLDGDGDVDVDDVMLLDTPEEAAPIYKKYYWDRMKLDTILSGVDFLMFDFGVNSGPKNAVKILQRALNREGFNLTVDGVLGSATVGYVQGRDNYETQGLIDNMLLERRNFYNRLVAINPSQSVFLKGWLNRLKRVSEEVKEFC